MSPTPSTPPARSAVDPEMNTRSPTRRAREYAYTPSRGPPDGPRCPGVSAAVDGVELDLYELLRPGQTVDGDQGGGGPRVLEVTGDRASRRIRHGDVGDVDAAAHHVVQATAGLAHAPCGDPHDGIDLSGDVAHAMNVALAVDGGRAPPHHPLP